MIILPTVTTYPSSRSCCQYLPQGDPSEEMAALQSRPRPRHSPSGAQLRRGSQRQWSHQTRGKSEISLCYTYRSVDIYLGSIIIVEVGTAMPISSLLEWGQILDPAILAVLTHSVKGGEVVSSCEDDRATQVDGTGPTIKSYY